VPERFSVIRRPRRPGASFYRGYDAVVTPTVRPALAAAKRRWGFRLVVDLYDPVILEALEWLSARPPAEQEHALARQRRELWLALHAADHFTCASEVQRDMWIGALTTAGRIGPRVYAEDPRLRRLIDVMPFGVSTEPRERGGPGLRERFGLGRDDLLLLWGGGIWNWLDPLTLIESVAEVAAVQPATKLVFMGMEHPNDELPEMAMALRARHLADALGITDRHVFFNYGWVPYERRGDLLLDADVGVCTHADHLETHFAFRTRNLDYLWAGLPILSTRGDVFAAMLDAEGAGVTVPPHDRAALSEAIGALHDPKLREPMAAASRALGERMAWPAAVRPLLAMLDGGAPLVRPNPARLAQAAAGNYAAAARKRLAALVPGRRG
jgi:glycosyltransferase involved in cell wall biosynthesis